MISENTSFPLKQFWITVLQYLGQHNGSIHYYKVNLKGEDSEHPHLGLLRVGSATGLLQQELQLREILQQYPLVTPLLAQTKVATVAELVASESSQNIQVETLSSQIPPEDTLQAEIEIEDAYLSSEGEIAIEEETLQTESLDETEPEDREVGDRPPESVSEEIVIETDAESLATEDSNYLEEEYYPEEPLPGQEGDRLVLLTAFPDSEHTLSAWLKNQTDPKRILPAIAQICQLFWYFHQRNWCMVDVNPEFLEIGQPICCFDLTCVYPEGETLPWGLTGTYCAPELASKPIPDEKTSTYTIGALLYHALYGHPPKHDWVQESKQCFIPGISQLLAISLSPIAEERFGLEQLRSLLIDTRNSLTRDRITWETASESTVGLSPDRLQNEDSYGMTHIDRGASDWVILAALADGMGGMAQGEVASRLAVQTALDGLRETQKTSDPKGKEWLIALVEQANAVVSEAVHNGGTTLSLVLAESGQLAIAHVGDSRIYLIHDGQIQQLSEDHSLVALMVASGQLSAAESQTHPDRNVLTKSLGSKKSLSPGYVQSVSDIELNDSDVVLLCSDGVWDLVKDEELTEYFTSSIALQTAVNEVIQLVLKRGASDNATLLALRCRISPVAMDFPREPHNGNPQ